MEGVSEEFICSPGAGETFGKEAFTNPDCTWQRQSNLRSVLSGRVCRSVVDSCERRTGAEIEGEVGSGFSHYPTVH